MSDESEFVVLAFNPWFALVNCASAAIPHFSRLLAFKIFDLKFFHRVTKKTDAFSSQTNEER